MSEPRNGGRKTMLERPVIRDAFRKELRATLMSEAVVVLAPRPRLSLFAQPWLRPAFAVAAVLILALAGATSAAASSLPGDPLYGLKRTTEDVQLALTFDDLARMQLLSELADRRLGELAEIAKDQPASAPTATTEYADAVERFADAVDKLRAADSGDTRDAAQAVADAARAKHIAVLDSLKDNLPDNARSKIDKVIERENQRSAPTDQRQGSDENKDHATPRPAGATPQRATPRPTQRPAPTARPTDRQHD
jgi:Domain of unknown function (DUF5667)